MKSKGSTSYCAKAWPIGVCAIVFAGAGAVLAILYQPQSAAIWAGIGTAAGAGVGTALSAALGTKESENGES